MDLSEFQDKMRRRRAEAERRLERPRPWYDSAWFLFGLLLACVAASLYIVIRYK